MLDDFENIKISARVSIKKSLTSHINIKIYNLGFWIMFVSSVMYINPNQFSL